MPKPISWTKIDTLNFTHLVIFAYDYCPEVYATLRHTRHDETTLRAQLHRAKILRDYQAAMRKTHDKVSLFDMGKQRALTTIFTDVYLLEQAASFSPTVLEFLEQNVEKRREKRVAGLEVVKTHPKLYIVGLPGAGKTTFLRHIALQALDELQFDEDYGVTATSLGGLPIFVTLREWADSGLSLGEFLRKKYPDSFELLKQCLQQGRAIVLLDGLDEVNQAEEQRDNLIQQIEAFQEQFADCRYVLTCRVATQQYRLHDFEYVEIAGFDESQISDFTHHWFETDPTIAKKLLEELKKSEHNRLKELASSPLLLTMLCAFFEGNEQFPAKRTEIYQQALDKMLGTWDEDRRIKRHHVYSLAYRNLSLEQKNALYADIAYHTFGKERFFEQKKLVKWIKQHTYLDGLDILQALEAQHGIIIEVATGFYAFAHLTFHEYYMADYLAQHPKICLSELAQHGADSSWREVWLMVASLLEETTPFFETFLRILQGMVQQDIQLVRLLQWAEHKANTVSTTVYKPAGLRAYYLTFTFARARAFAFALVQAFALARAFALALALDLALARALARALDLAFDLARARDFTLARNLALALARNLALAHNLARARNLARNLARNQDLYLDESLDLLNLWSVLLSEALFLQEIGADVTPILREWWGELLQHSQVWGYHDLAQALGELTMPTAQDTAETWRAFADRLRLVMQQQRNIGHAWNLSEEQEKLLAKYLQANELFVDCLALAHVENREALEGRLLLVG